MSKQITLNIIFSMTFTAVIQAEVFKDYPIRPINARNVQLHEGFWAERIETNRTATVSHIIEKLEQTGRVTNFLKAAGKMEGEYQGFHFNDSDVYKVIEALSYMIANRPDDKLAALCEQLVDAVVAAQEADGYLHPFITLTKTEDRWQHPHRHELYSMGHMLLAGIAHYESTGYRKLLDAGINLANRICEDFDPVTGAQRRPPEHQVLETGLAELYRITGDQKYIDMAHYFLMLRGKADGRTLYGPYAQDHQPVLEQEKAVGHAVRATYMYCAMADTAALSVHEEYIQPLKKLWENVISQHMYVTGGIGAQGGGESFGQEYVLPNMSSYCETCAAIGMVFWNQRLFQLFGEAKYIDVMERVLYNGLLSGVSLDGKSFFYPNPLASYGQHGRSEWFGCACCPTNIIRFFPKLAEYIYAQDKDGIYVNLFAASEAEISRNNSGIKIIQETRYPWEGHVEIQVYSEKAARFNLRIRIPGWALNRCVPSDLYSFDSNEIDKPKVYLNGKIVNDKLENGYVVINRTWQNGDRIELNIPMPVRRIIANEQVEEDHGKVALQRGPIVYCAEGADNPDRHIMNRFIPEDTEFKFNYLSELLNGINIITAEVPVAVRDGNGGLSEEKKESFKAIPYYAWANRGSGEMAVWFPESLDLAHPLQADTIAFKSKITTSGGLSARPLADQLEPRSSNDHSMPYFHWWPNLGTAEWVQFDFEKKEEISAVKVYWFDDTGIGSCRVPESWKIFYMQNREWRPVENPNAFGIETDLYNITRFDLIETSAIKIEIQMQQGFSSGLQEVVIE